MTLLSLCTSYPVMAMRCIESLTALRMPRMDESASCRSSEPSQPLLYFNNSYTHTHTQTSMNTHSRLSKVAFSWTLHNVFFLMFRSQNYSGILFFKEMMKNLTVKFIKIIMISLRYCNKDTITRRVLNVWLRTKPTLTATFYCGKPEVWRTRCQESAAGLYLEEELVFGDALYRFQQVRVQAQLVLKFLLALLAYTHACRRTHRDTHLDYCTVPWNAPTSVTQS